MSGMNKQEAQRMLDESEAGPVRDLAEWALLQQRHAFEYARQARQALRLLDASEEMPDDISELRL